MRFARLSAAVVAVAAVLAAAAPVLTNETALDAQGFPEYRVRAYVNFYTSYCIDMGCDIIDVGDHGCCGPGEFEN